MPKGPAKSGVPFNPKRALDIKKSEMLDLAQVCNMCGCLTVDIDAHFALLHSEVLYETRMT